MVNSEDFHLPQIPKHYT